MDEKTLRKLEDNAKEYYDKGTVAGVKQKDIETEQKRLIALLYELDLKVIGINVDIKNEGKKPLTDLDVVVYHDDTVLIFGVKNQKEDHFANLEQFSGIKTDLFDKYITKLYGSSPTIDYKFIYYDAKADSHEHKHMKGEVDDVIILFKEDLDYFSKICKVEKRLARNDLLATIAIRYKGKTEARTGIVYNMDGTNVYMLFVSPKDLFSCVVIPRKRNLTSGLSAFQRSIDEERLTSISDYIKNPVNGFAFPNAIILASDAKLNSTAILINLKADLVGGKAVLVGGELADRWGTSAVSLNFPIDYGALKLIDGQHRLLGYAKTDPSTQEERRFPILILEGMIDSRKAKIFLDINSKSKPVDSNLRLLISSEIDWPSNMKLMLREKAIVEVILKLINEKVISEDEIFLGHAGVEKKDTLTLRTAVSSIKTSKLDHSSLGTYAALKALINKLKNSKNSSFYLDNIGFRILNKIISKCLDDRPKENRTEMMKDSEEKYIIVGDLFDVLVDSLDKLPNLKQLGYGEKGAKDRAYDLMSELKTKFDGTFGYLSLEED